MDGQRVSRSDLRNTLWTGRLDRPDSRRGRHGHFVGIALHSQRLRQHGVPRVTLMRMAVNVAVDYLLGAVPLLGDVFDVYWKANQRNVNLLRQHLQTSPAQERRSRIADGLFMVALVLVLIAILIGSLTLAYFIVTRLAELITHR